MATSAKFNVGGKIYQVSRSLLEQYPDTMLSRSASQRWQEDPNTEIFIERDSSRFRYILDYLRDGQVSLPLTESKDALIKDLEYCGVAFDEAKIDNSKEHMATSLTSIKQLSNELQGIYYEGGCAELANFCLRAYLRLPLADQQKAKADVYFNQNDTINGGDRCYRSLQDILRLQSFENMIQKVNMHLKRVGLEVINLDFDRATLRHLDPVTTTP